MFFCPLHLRFGGTAHVSICELCEKVDPFDAYLYCSTFGFLGLCEDQVHVVARLCGLFVSACVRADCFQSRDSAGGRAPADEVNFPTWTILVEACARVSHGFPVVVHVAFRLWFRGFTVGLFILGKGRERRRSCQQKPLLFTPKTVPSE